MSSIKFGSAWKPDIIIISFSDIVIYQWFALLAKTQNMLILEIGLAILPMVFLMAKHLNWKNTNNKSTFENEFALGMEAASSDKQKQKFICSFC